MKVLCVFGKYAYGDPSREVSPEYAAIIPALEKLGYTVVHFELWQRTHFKTYAEMNVELFKTVIEEKPNIIFSVQLNYEIWIETLNAIRNLGNALTICWTTDDSWKYREVSRFLGKYYHVITTTYKNKLKSYRQDGIENVFLTQWAANSYSLQSPISARKCKYNVSFIGAAHGNRKQRIENLRKLGIDVTCFGYGWPNGPVKTEEIPTIMRQSIISLNFANSKGQNQIKARNFEVPGAGGFLLAEYAPGLEEFYSFGQEIAVFNSTKELAHQINYYLQNVEERDRIAKAGFERTKKDHTYEERLKKLLAYTLTIKPTKKSPSIEHEISKLIVASESSVLTPLLKQLRQILILACNLIFGKERGIRAARRIVFELSWRFLKHRTYTASGLPSRLFPEL